MSAQILELPQQHKARRHVPIAQLVLGLWLALRMAVFVVALLVRALVRQ